MAVQSRNKEWCGENVFSESSTFLWKKISQNYVPLFYLKNGDIRFL
jgi:hypothetical protein